MSVLCERSDRARWRQALAALGGLALLGGVALLAGCAGEGEMALDHPIDWWHQLQGGPIAAERPPPPGITDPYPTFAVVPPRPQPVDFAKQRALVAQMTAARNQASRLNQQDPIVFSSPNGAAKPGAAKPATPAAAPASAAGSDADTSRLSFDAANATPTPAPQAAPKPANDPHPPTALVTSQNETPVVSGPIPEIPQSAPPLPQLPGLPTNEAVPVIPRAIPTATVRFARGSAALPESAEAALRALVNRRAGAPITVTAGGEARSASVQAQREALPLALRRTGAITAALVAAGVPASDIHAEAMAQGRDASARLLN